VLVLSGPNLDRLGTREPLLYGTTTLADIHARLEQLAAREGASVECRQSPHEGELVRWIGAAKGEGFAGIVLNAGSLTHGSIPILDALLLAGVPAVEVHVTNPEAREAFRHVSMIARACAGKVAGFGPASYELGLLGLLGSIRAAKRGSRARQRTASNERKPGASG
jgi:3-dehydroquinate dehydratase-2